MTLYLKPAEDGKSVGDCPFAHFVRMVLAEKGLEYELVPSTQEAKPQWLIEDYGGKMPALRHRKECYVDSEVIAQYLDFFFKEPELSGSSVDTTKATEVVDGFFPAMAKFVKHNPNGDDEDKEKQVALEEKLLNLETQLSSETRSGKSALVLFYDTSSCDLYEVLVIRVLYFAFLCLYLIAFANLMY